MLRSMTGFGSAQVAVGAHVLGVEIRTVNHKYCDVRVRLPRELATAENEISSRVRARLSRGRIEVGVEITSRADAALAPRLNHALARAHHEAARALAESLGAPMDLGVAALLALPGVLMPPAGVLDSPDWPDALQRAVDEALDAVDGMRRKEGESLAAELSRHVDDARRLVSEIDVEVRASHGSRHERLRARLEELAPDSGVDPVRVAQEVALLLERADVAEELARLASHFDQLDGLLVEPEPVGRKLDFLLQEMHRETNTIGSKSASARVSHLVVELKSVLERVREQVQNVE